MTERDFYLILIGVNIGVPIGFYACKKFKGNFRDFMYWLEGLLP